MRRTWAVLKSTVILSLLAGCSSDVGHDGSGANTGGSGNGENAGSSGSSGAVSNGSKGGTGGTNGNGTSGSSGSSGASGNSGSSGSAGSNPVTSAPPDCKTDQVAHTALRRLTRFEYAQTVKDLLKVDPTPSNDIPADEVTSGYDNNASVLTISSLHAEKYVLVSEALAKAAVQNLAAIDGCNTATGEEACARQFAQKFGRRAFRRPLSDADVQNLMTAYAAGRTDGSYAEGIEVMIRAALQSPDFLFRLETTAPADANATLVPLSQFELATRLSYLIWATGPDDALLDAAQAGSLGSKQAVAQKAREMLADPKAKLALANFFGQWSGTNRLPITTKNTTLFPSFTAAMQTAMEAEVPAFLDYVFSGDHSFKTLLTAPVAFVSGPLAQLYVPGSPMGGATPTKMDLPATQGRAGILTMAGFMSVQGHPDQTSPVLRGKFVRAMMLCDPPPPPPDDVNITLPTIDQGATARERFSKHEDAGASCKGCHAMMDPIGLAFENFDAIGSFRTMDNGQPIDVSGEVTDADDPALQGGFNGVAEMAQKLAASQTVSDCMATQWFRFASGRLELEQDACSLGNIRRSFADSNGDLVELVVAMTQSDDFWYRAPLTP